jgi:hypothetical protein
MWNVELIPVEFEGDSCGNLVVSFNISTNVCALCIAL